MATRSIAVIAEQELAGKATLQTQGVKQEASKLFVASIKVKQFELKWDICLFLIASKQKWFRRCSQKLSLLSQLSHTAGTQDEGTELPRKQMFI